MALLRLKKLYRAAGLPMDSSELPDHLTVMLAFAALAPAGHGEALLAEHRPAIELLRLSLHDLSSPYAHVLDAIAAVPAGAQRDRARRGRAARARGPARGGGRPASPTGRRRRCRPERAHERRRDPAVDHPPLRRRDDLHRRHLVALPRRPVRLDERLDPALRAEDPRLGRARVPLRRARRRRRARDRADDPEVVHRGRRHVRAAPTAGSRRSPAPSPARCCVVGFVGLVYRRDHQRPGPPHDLADRPARLLPARRADRARAAG